MPVHLFSQNGFGLDFCSDVCMFVCVSVHLWGSLITSGMMWYAIIIIYMIDWLTKFYGFYMEIVGDIFSEHIICIRTRRVN